MNRMSNGDDSHAGKRHFGSKPETASVAVIVKLTFVLLFGLVAFHSLNAKRQAEENQRVKTAITAREEVARGDARPNSKARR